jgi:hypothetical protein
MFARPSLTINLDETVELMDLSSAQREFTAYGPSHWAVIAVFAIGSALLVWIGRSQTESQARRLGRTLGSLTAAIYGSVLAYSLIPPTIEGSVPLRLTDLATVAAAYALWSQRHWPFALTYHSGLTLSTQALISPALKSSDFPTTSSSAFGQFTCSSSGQQPSTSRGAGGCVPSGAATGSRYWLQWSGQQQPSLSTASPEPTTASSTETVPGVAIPPTPFGRAGERRKTRVVNYSRQLRVLPLTIER